MILPQATGGSGELGANEQEKRLHHLGFGTADVKASLKRACPAWRRGGPGVWRRLTLALSLRRAGTGTVVEAEVLLFTSLAQRSGIKLHVAPDDADAAAGAAAEARQEAVEMELDVLAAIYGEDVTHTSTDAGTFVAVKLGRVPGVRGSSAVEVFIPATPLTEGGALYPAASPVVWFLCAGIPPAARLTVTVALARKAAELRGEQVVHELVTWAKGDDGAGAAIMSGKPPRLPLLSAAPAADAPSATASSGAPVRGVHRQRRGQPRRQPQGPSPAQVRRLNEQLLRQWREKQSKPCVHWGRCSRAGVPATVLALCVSCALHDDLYMCVCVRLALNCAEPTRGCLRRGRNCLRGVTRSRSGRWSPTTAPFW